MLFFNEHFIPWPRVEVSIAVPVTVPAATEARVVLIGKGVPVVSEPENEVVEEEAIAPVVASPLLLDDPVF